MKKTNLTINNMDENAGVKAKVNASAGVNILKSVSISF